MSKSGGYNSEYIHNVTFNIEKNGGLNMLTKKEFIKQYKKLTPEQKKEVKQFHEEKYKNAIFEETFNTAEKCLLWIREIEEN